MSRSNIYALTLNFLFIYLYFDEEKQTACKKKIIIKERDLVRENFFFPAIHNVFVVFFLRHKRIHNRSSTKGCKCYLFDMQEPFFFSFF